MRGYQWQTWDLLCGRLEPELGGSPEALDLVGVNYYHSGQWEVGTEERLDWHLDDPRRMPFSALLAEAWQRYRRPLLVAETSHVGEGRADWLEEIAAEVGRALAVGVPVLGLCLYPFVDRHDWDDPGHWHASGLRDASSYVTPIPLRNRSGCCNSSTPRPISGSGGLRRPAAGTGPGRCGLRRLPSRRAPESSGGRCSNGCCGWRGTTGGANDRRGADALQQAGVPRPGSACAGRRVAGAAHAVACARLDGSRPR